MYVIPLPVILQQTYNENSSVAKEAEKGCCIYDSEAERDANLRIFTVLFLSVKETLSYCMPSRYSVLLRYSFHKTIEKTDFFKEAEEIVA